MIVSKEIFLVIKKHSVLETQAERTSGLYRERLHLDLWSLLYVNFEYYCLLEPSLRCCDACTAKAGCFYRRFNQKICWRLYKIHNQILLARFFLGTWIKCFLCHSFFRKKAENEACYHWAEMVFQIFFFLLSTWTG